MSLAAWRAAMADSITSPQACRKLPSVEKAEERQMNPSPAKMVLSEFRFLAPAARQPYQSNGPETRGSSAAK